MDQHWNECHSQCKSYAVKHSGVQSQNVKFVYSQGFGVPCFKIEKTKRHILVQTQSANLNLLLHCRKLVPPCACVHSPLKSNQNLENELTILMEHFGVHLRFSKGPGRLSVEHTHQGDCSFSQAILLDDTPLMYQIKNFSSISTCKIENCLFATRMYRDVLSHI